MIPEELSLAELLTHEADGPICFLGERALVLDVVALGLLRKEVIETLGPSVARGVFTRFGYAHGWTMAQRMRDLFQWRDAHDLERAGGRLHSLAGFMKINILPDGGPLAPKGKAVEDSFEAVQHLAHSGRSDEPVCWILCGLASGYISNVRGESIWVIEDRCIARGDACCRLVGRTREDWGEAIEPHLRFFESQRPEESLEALAATLDRLERQAKTRRRELAREEASIPGNGRIVGRSEAMRKVLETARRAARVAASVLVTGETGVGKEEVARLIHEESARSDGPFVAVNCGALTESLAESELFGHARGAFTGASVDRAGLIEEAQGGTLLLDEIGDLPLPIQVKLLRTLETGELRRVGENRVRRVDVRIVAATHRDLAESIDEGAFRSDLYYRLKVIEVVVPPLRERLDDILPLARHFLLRAATAMERDIAGLSPEAAEQLLRYDWPGNVREVKHAMERGVALSDSGRIGVEDLPEEIRAALPRPVVAEGVRPLAELEREYILAALEHNDGHRARTAKQLGIGETTLYRKLEKYRRSGHAA